MMLDTIPVQARKEANLVIDIEIGIYLSIFLVSGLKFSRGREYVKLSAKIPIAQKLSVISSGPPLPQACMFVYIPKILTRSSNLPNIIHSLQIFQNIVVLLLQIFFILHEVLNVLTHNYHASGLGHKANV